MYMVCGNVEWRYKKNRKKKIITWSDQRHVYYIIIVKEFVFSRDITLFFFLYYFFSYLPLYFPLLLPSNYVWGTNEWKMPSQCPSNIFSTFFSYSISFNPMSLFAIFVLLLSPSSFCIYKRKKIPFFFSWNIPF